MGKPTGFKEIPRKAVPYREPLVRLEDSVGRCVFSFLTLGDMTPAAGACLEARRQRDGTTCAHGAVGRRAGHQCAFACIGIAYSHCAGRSDVSHWNGVSEPMAEQVVIVSKRRGRSCRCNDEYPLVDAR